MTRKDFQLIADAIAEASENHPELFRLGASAIVAHRLADALAGTNDRFDREKFLTACGVK
jgi:hypothetical protein